MSDPRPALPTDRPRPSDLSQPAESVSTTEPTPAPAPSAETVATAEPETVSEAPPAAPEPPPPPKAIDRLAIGTHVVETSTDPETGAERTRYGIVVESSVLPGASAGSYLVGWLDTDGDRRCGHDQVTTTRDHAKAKKPGYRR